VRLRRDEADDNRWSEAMVVEFRRQPDDKTEVGVGSK
jgi:hypothetical protein